MKGIMFKIKFMKSPREENKISGAQEIVDSMIGTARKIASEKGEVRPVLMVLREDVVEFAAVGPFFENDITKEAFRIFVMDMCQEKDVEGVGLATEVWHVKQEGVDMNIRPSEHPDRVEAVMIYGEWRDCSQATIFAPILRDEQGNVSLGDPDPLVYDNMTGRMVGFFPQRDESKVH